MVQMSEKWTSFIQFIQQAVDLGYIYIYIYIYIYTHHIYIYIYICTYTSDVHQQVYSLNASVSKEKYYNVNCTAYVDLCNSNLELPNSCMAITG